MGVASFSRTLDQELAAISRGASYECLVCGEFLLRRRVAHACLECGTCLAVAAPGALTWHYPRGGFGVQFREG